MDELFGRQFQSVDEARAVIDALAQPLGYNFVKHRVRPNSIEFRCSKGRTYKSQRSDDIPAARRRETSSQMTGCPYRLVVGRQHALSPWVIRRSRSDSANEHNHPMFPSAAHSRYRGMAIEKRMENIMSLYNSGLKPIQILAQLQSENNPDLEGLTRHDIYNAIRKHRQQEELDGLTGKT
ncbi:uncharacterized protein TRIVIDRAFT_223638 [Trichoderma virens Gv29-8]|uniref:FAR1 domain-containing protein n=1 Tax=Hypocrea virens (strain Gv29-8 / FGSC 10586) TaxID=413071 RepID=G9MXQ7_HYPVG|nr:uncharacterized protein TRIVIDRAFT_223638 [Trichoderma virens Gv29-8]EHK20668.1 hypothetical protein TRIVIDRAFT_223638 [Trichoderma virens Gv29-8]UKZ56959.1 hypothetical protein TrVGV298_010807 [Trichoderma virens]